MRGDSLLENDCGGISIRAHSPLSCGDLHWVDLPLAAATACVRWYDHYAIAAGHYDRHPALERAVCDYWHALYVLELMGGERGFFSGCAQESLLKSGKSLKVVDPEGEVFTMSQYRVWGRRKAKALLRRSLPVLAAAPPIRLRNVKFSTIATRGAVDFCKPVSGDFHAVELQSFPSIGYTVVKNGSIAVPNGMALFVERTAETEEEERRRWQGRVGRRTSSILRFFGMLKTDGPAGYSQGEIFSVTNCRSTLGTAAQQAAFAPRPSGHAAPPPFPPPHAHLHPSSASPGVALLARLRLPRAPHLAYPGHGACCEAAGSSGNGGGATGVSLLGWLPEPSGPPTDSCTEAGEEDSE